MASAKPKTMPGPARTARRARLALAGALLVIGLAIVVYPLLPSIGYWIHRPTPQLPYQTRLTANSSVLQSLPKLPTIGNRPVPKENRLLIPSIGVDMPILEGADERVLDRGGVWHLPDTSAPDRSGNFVLSGHRWRYLPPSGMTLYLLDKVKDNDLVVVYWQGLEYDYRITGRDTITPDQTHILNATDGPRLTIFTCTPLFSTKYRLVLFGQLIP